MYHKGKWVIQILKNIMMCKWQTFIFGWTLSLMTGRTSQQHHVFFFLLGFFLRLQKRGFIYFGFPKELFSEQFLKELLFSYSVKNILKESSDAKFTSQVVWT